MNCTISTRHDNFHTLCISTCMQQHFVRKLFVCNSRILIIEKQCKFWNIAPVLILWKICKNSELKHLQYKKVNFLRCKAWNIISFWKCNASVINIHKYKCQNVFFSCYKKILHIWECTETIHHLITGSVQRSNIKIMFAWNVLMYIPSNKMLTK